MGTKGSGRVGSGGSGREGRVEGSTPSKIFFIERNLADPVIATPSKNPNRETHGRGADSGQQSAAVDLRLSIRDCEFEVDPSYGVPIRGDRFGVPIRGAHSRRQIRGDSHVIIRS